MSGYEKLVIVDQYEGSHSNHAAVLRACDVMLEYLSNLQRPLPEVAAQAVKIAQEYTAGALRFEALRDADAEISRFLKKTRYAKDLSKGTVSVVRASGALLKLLEDPTWGGGASEALSNILEWVDEFDQSHPLFERLLEKNFKRPER